MKKKARVDQALVERGFFESRERAQRAIMAGEVRMGDRVFTKAAELVEIDAPISIVQPPQFAIRHDSYVKTMRRDVPRIPCSLQIPTRGGAPATTMWAS